MTKDKTKKTEESNPQNKNYFIGISEEEVLKNIQPNFKSKILYCFENNVFKMQKKKFYQGVFAVLIINLLIGMIFKDSLFVVISFVASIISLNEIFFPQKYIILEKGIYIDKFTHKIKHSFAFYKKVYLDKNGIFLSPFAKKSRLDDFRGVLIKMPKELRKEFKAYIEDQIKALNKSEPE